MKKAVIYTMVFMAVLSLSAQSRVRGEIVYLEGDVTVSRKGEILPFYEVDMGLPLEEEDIIRTGRNGYIEIDMTYPSAGSTLKVKPDTVFYFESRENGGSSSTRVNLIGGSLGLKVNKLTRNESMNVETQSAVMGIRGTEFYVNKAPTGELLITCREGKVSCATPAMETFALPGNVCLQNDGQDFLDEAVPVARLDEYREQWWTLRSEALASLGPMAVQYYTGRYNRQIDLFENAWDEISRNNRLFDSYEDLIDRNETPATSQVMRDKMTLSSSVIKMRSALPIMEEIFYTLLILEEYQNRGIFTDNSRNLRDFSKKRDTLEKELVKSRYYLYLYSRISQMAGGSSSALDSMMNSPAF